MDQLDETLDELIAVVKRRFLGPTPESFAATVGLLVYQLGTVKETNPSLARAIAKDLRTKLKPYTRLQ